MSRTAWREDDDGGSITEDASSFCYSEVRSNSGDDGGLHGGGLGGGLS
ncbi:hypothetical protein A2U01_0060713 [Trifolium medium]|uniref:Uncharacterized protein n=2 Tax=Trifolium medium TaxID=97028 RepID=A0A392RS54_9FABA|nr:hypothetical protein [Trifolium medium]